MTNPNLRNLPSELLTAPRFFPVTITSEGKKLPKIGGWQKTENQMPLEQVNSPYVGFDTCGHEVGEDFLFLDFDHVLDEQGSFVNVEAQEYFNTIQNKFVGYAERSISGTGIHIFAKPTPGKFSKTTGRIYFDAEKKSFLEVFYKSAARYCLVTGELFKTDSRNIAEGAVVDDMLADILTDIQKQNGDSEKSARREQPAKTARQEDSPDYDRYRAEYMLRCINPADLEDSDWLACISAAKNIGLEYELVDSWNQRDPDRYHERENLARWDSLNNPSYDIRTLHGISRRFGYSERDTWHEYHGTQNRSRRVDFPEEEPPNYDLLFEGLKPIRISAGAILNVADTNSKPALEILFVERNFPAFVNCVAGEDVTQTDGNEPDVAVEYQTPFGVYGISSAQTRNTLKWLIARLYRYFGGNDIKLAEFIRKRLAAAQASGALTIIDDKNFFDEAVADAKKNTGDKFFDFGYKLKRELIAFAKHSRGIFQTLLRFNYRKVTDFLDGTFTDLVCGELIIDVQRNFLRFATDQATWYVWQKNHWQAVNVKSLASLFELWTPLARKARTFAEFESFKATCEIADFEINNDVTQKKSPAYGKYSRMLLARAAIDKKVGETKALERVRNMEAYFAQASGLPEIQITTEQLDQNKYLFNCANFTLNLKSMTKHPPRQSDLITLATSTRFDPNATSDIWDNFIKSAIPNPELRDWLQRFFGYCMSGDTQKDIFVFIHGKGGSGKTTFLNAISGAFGDYAKVFDVDLITANSKPKDGNEPNPALAALRACRLARSSETEKNRRLDEAKIKHLSGGDKLVARELHKPPFEFFPQFSIVVDGNYLLNISDIFDKGILRRLRIVPFNNVPDDNDIDTALEAKLSMPTARSAILNWCIEGWRQFQRRGLEDTPAVMVSAQQKFCDDNNAIAEFLDTYGYRAAREEKIPVKTVFGAYNKWHRHTPRTPAYSRADFVEALLQVTQEDNVTVRDYDHTQYFFGFSIDTAPVTNPYD